jgi:hypothetical protein
MESIGVLLLHRGRSLSPQRPVRQNLELVLAPLGHFVAPVVNGLTANPEPSREFGGRAEVSDSLFCAHGRSVWHA